jgi:hypothetical protein
MRAPSATAARRAQLSLVECHLSSALDPALARQPDAAALALGAIVQPVIVGAGLGVLSDSAFRLFVHYLYSHDGLRAASAVAKSAPIDADNKGTAQLRICIQISNPMFNHVLCQCINIACGFPVAGGGWYPTPLQQVQGNIICLPGSHVAPFWVITQ